MAAAGAGVLALSGLTWFGLTSLASGLTTSNAINDVKLAPGVAAPKHLDKSVNVLLVGLDSRYAMNGDPLPDSVVHDELDAGSCSACLGGQNTNTLIIMHIPANGGRVTAISIPRDDYVETQDGQGGTLGQYKIKEAYGRAYTIAVDKARGQGIKDVHQLASIGHEAGRKATIATVESLLDIPIDHFAEVNLIGFYDVAKAVGPVAVCLRHKVYDPNIAGVGGSGANFPAGLNTLGPTQALRFVRQRHNLTNGDLDRTHRQQAFISAVVAKLKKDGVIGDLGKMGALIHAAQSDVVIDNGWDPLTFAAEATNLTSGNTEFSTLPITGFQNVVIDRQVQSVNMVDPAALRADVKAYFAEGEASGAAPTSTPSATHSASAPPPPVTVTGTAHVYNASGVTGAAGREATALDGLGLQATAVGNSSHRTHTVVLYGSGAAAAGKAAADQLGGITAEASSDVSADTIVVYLGTDKANDVGGGTPTGTTSPPPTSIPDTGANGAAVSGSGPNSIDGIPCVN